MRGVAVAALLVVLAGCSATGDEALGPLDPIHREQPLEARIHDPWGNRTHLVVLEGRVNWHDDPNAFSNTYDRVTQPVAHPCAYNGGVYFNNVLLGAASVWNFTTRLEAVLEWDPLSYTADTLRIGYDAGDGYADSPPGGNGETITVPVTQEMWDPDPDPPGRFGGNVGIAACPGEDTGRGTPPYFEGELRYKITAFK